MKKFEPPTTGKGFEYRVKRVQTWAFPSIPDRN
jgi:hypothetical protein